MQIYENFISYRRSESLAEVQNIYHALQQKGFSTFCDIYNLNSGRFDENLLKVIDCCTNYILVLSPQSLDRCSNDDDWLRFEIKEAIEKKKNIVCVFIDDVKFPDFLPKDIDAIRYYNGVKYDFVYFDSFIDNLISRFFVNSEDSEISDAMRDFVIDGSRLVKYVGYASIVSVPSGITVIGRDAFKDRTRINSVSFPDGIITIEECAFERCINIAHLSMPASLKEIGRRAFARCYNLSFVAFNNALNRIDNEAFAFCTKLKTVRFGEEITYIDPTAFNNCNKLAFFSVDDDNQNYSSFDGILYKKDQTELVRCPEGYNSDVINVLPSVTSLGPWCFSKCLNIIDVILPRGLKKVCEYAFNDCSNILSLTLGDSVTEFAINALSGWNSSQRVVVGKKFSPLIKYQIEKKISEQPSLPLIGDDVPEFILVKTTYESREEAAQTAKMLIDHRYAASVQLYQLNVFYTWNDECCNEDEVELSCITRGNLFQKVARFIKQHHSYDCCQIIGVPISNTTEEFAEWITAQTDL